eukprot:gnl/TRDRNA2_/TRDRNA2_149041_c0_seq1.p1 gnl/TRDRNA2_/TRDRNA2_149041_c0~~gnl/TRDRNA2_/TRDRNA2_149041_c0_seq1.p1  ORF type:complete len:467 (+),score=33.09 gnl/TRDRNA2_/TRDRNA2_149041_c0_seq1:42-1403(+)
MSPLQCVLTTILCAEIASSCGFVALCRLVPSFGDKALQQPLWAWGFWAGIGLVILLCVGLSEWLHYFEKELKEKREREPQAPQAFDRRHALLMVGLASVIWDSLSEWRNPAPEQGWHFEVQQPIPHSEVSIDPEEKLGRIWDLFTERIFFGFTLMLHLFQRVAMLLRLLQTVHLTATMLLFVVALFLEIMIAGSVTMFAQIYLALKVELPFKMRAHKQHKSLAAFFGGSKMPRDLLPKILDYVPRQGFPNRELVFPGPPYEVVYHGSHQLKIRYIMGSHPHLLDGWILLQFSRMHPRDEAVLHNFVGVLVRLFRRLVALPTQLYESASLGVTQCLSNAVSFATSLPAEDPDRLQEDAAIAREGRRVGVRGWLGLLLWLPWALPLTLGPLGIQSFFLILLLVGLLKNFVMGLMCIQPAPGQVPAIEMLPLQERGAVLVCVDGWGFCCGCLGHYP